MRPVHPAGKAVSVLFRKTAKRARPKRCRALFQKLLHRLPRTARRQISRLADRIEAALKFRGGVFECPQKLNR